MGAAFVIFLVGLVSLVLGVAEMKRSAVRGPGTALAGILLCLLGMILLFVAIARFLWNG